MPSFSKRSLKARSTCHPKLQEVLDEAIKHYDFSVIWGHRGRTDQDRAYEAGHSKLQWPASKHNSLPSKAFDIVPYPDGFNSPHSEFYLQATYVLRAALKLGVHLNWGGHWKNFKDLAHFELMEDGNERNSIRE